MAYISSSNINVFPIAKKRTTDVYSRSFTEHNMTSWLSSVTDSQCWVVDYSNARVDTVDNKLSLFVGSLKFFLNGYLFNVTNSALPIDDEGNVRAVLVYSNSNSDNLELEQDTENGYEGVKFLGTEDTEVAGSVLFRISENTDGTEGEYKIEPQYVKFQQGSVEITKIDGKRLLTISE